MNIKSRQTNSIITETASATFYSYTGAFTISWPASTDAASGPSYYHLAQSSNFGSNYADASPSKVDAPATSWSPVSALAEGAYRYIVRAYDAAGNISSAPDSAKEYLGDVIVDKTAPTIRPYLPFLFLSICYQQTDYGSCASLFNCKPHRVIAWNKKGRCK